MKPAVIAQPGLQFRAAPVPTVNLYTPRVPFQATVVHKERLTHRSSSNSAWHVVLSLEGSTMAGRYRIGQSIGVVPEGRFTDPNFNYAHQLLNKRIRLYSIASPRWGDDWKGQTVSLCVKRELLEDEQTGELVFGEASNFLCDLKQDDPVWITGPSGKTFLLPDNPLDHHYVFAATGTGIAPFRGMLIELLEQGYQEDVWLVFGVPYSTDILYDQEFLKLAERHPNFHYVTAISREQTNAHGDKLYVSDRLEELQHVLAPLLNQPETLFYICGVKGMEFGIFQWLFRIESNLVRVPDGIAPQQIQSLQGSSKVWDKIERVRDKARLLIETY